MMRILALLLALTPLAASFAAPCRQAERGPRLTFFGWSDQHVQTNGDGRHLEPAIDAMNRLPGREYPADVAGRVEAPAFVLGAGDITEWPTAAARDTYDRLLASRLKFPAFDIPGNHDTGGEAPSPTILNWLKQKHGALSYAFDRGGIRFVMVDSAFDPKGPPAQPVGAEALAFLRSKIRSARDMPVIPVLHLCLDAITNRDALVDALAGGRVPVVIGGHYHKAALGSYRGIRFLQLPSPAPGAAREFTVVRIANNRIVAIPFDYAADRWAVRPEVILNGPLLPPPPSRP